MYFSYSTTEPKPNRSLILSSGVKLIWVPMKFGLISTFEPRVLEFEKLVRLQMDNFLQWNNHPEQVFV